MKSKSIFMSKFVKVCAQNVMHNGLPSQQNIPTTYFTFHNNIENTLTATLT